MQIQSVLLLGLAALASAWIPGESIPKRANVNEGLWGRNALSSAGRRWLPTSSAKFRGVNLGSHFIVEPWMASDEWNSMGCGGEASEFDCMMKLGQSAGDAAFQKHWAEWITQDDIQQMAANGLNTIRIPIGYWMREDIVDRSTEHFPQGGFKFLQQVCDWAATAGLYIILDLHGAPGSQVAGNAFAGQNTPTPGFYNSYNYERAYKFLEWMTENIHKDTNFRNVGALQVVNEPVNAGQYPSEAASLISTYYPTAWSRIRAAEDKLNISDSGRIHIQMMNEKWGSGNPNQNLKDLNFAFYDDHRYLKFSSDIPANRDSYLSTSCHDDRSGNNPVVVGEWSLSVADSAQSGPDFSLDAPDAVSWYKKWYAAQIMAYEKQAGWIFWSWKANFIGGENDWRWSYKAALAAGAIPKNPDDAYNLGACDGV